MVGCGEDPIPEAASIWEAPASLVGEETSRFFDHPWPSDLRLVNGVVPLVDYPNPKQVPIIDTYLKTMDQKLDGFSPAAAGYLRFTGPLEPSSLGTDPVGTVSSSAPVQLIDIEPNSPEHGKRRPVSLKFRAESAVYYQPNTLAFMPALGFPLRPHTRYAFVVTDAVRGQAGGTLTKSKSLSEVLGEAEATTTAENAAAKEALAPAVAEIESAGIPRSKIVHLAVFRTNDPTEELLQARDDLRANVEAPTVFPGSWALAGTKDAYSEYIGKYGPSPNYQAGKLPFEKAGDGGDLNKVNGLPAVFDTFDLRFSLTVPNSPACPMPEEGFPIVLYAHGTGGDYRSYVRDGTARSLAFACMASMGVDQIFHGKRPGAPPDEDESKISLLFFNIENVVAARTNSRQGALDEVQRARLFTESHIEVPATVAVTGKAIRFDGSRLSFFGHSQGGLNGPLFLAADDQARGGVLSGASSVMAITLLEKTEPSPSVADLVKTIFLGLGNDDENELNLFHPALSIAQMLVDTTDPLHYARYIVREPRDGFSSKSIYMTEGINPEGDGDSYAPPAGIEMHSVAMGLPLLLPGTKPFPESSWSIGPGVETLTAAGIMGNLRDGAATGVLAQFAVPDGSDGHFVVFDVPEARTQSTAFLRSLSEGTIGKVSLP